MATPEPRDESEVRLSTYSKQALELLKYKVYDTQTGKCKSSDVYCCQNMSTLEVVDIKVITIPEEDKRNGAKRSISALKDWDHPNILKLLDVLNSGDELYLVFQHCEYDLHTYWQNLAIKDNRLVKYWLDHILSAVAYYHSHKFLHGDLKPQNIMVHNNAELKLANFGAARAFDVPLSPSSNEVGSHHYMAPELLFGSTKYSSPVDIWSAGIIFAELAHHGHLQFSSWVRRQPLFPGLNESGKLTEIFRLLGTPTEEIWPGLTSGCDFIAKIGAPMKPKDLGAEFPFLEPAGVDLLSKMLCLCPNDRISAEDAINHPYFHDLRERVRPSTNSKQALECLNYRVDDYQTGKCKSSDVYRCQNMTTLEMVDIKIVSIPEEEKRTRAKRDIYALKEWEHDNLLKLQNVLTNGDELYLVFQHCENDLHTYMEKLPITGVPSVKHWLRHILSAISYYHSHKFLHGDLKPQNIMVFFHDPWCSRSTLKLANFGAATAFDVPLSSYSNEVGSLPYMAPELLFGSTKYSTPVDIWSAGCIFAELVYRRPLFTSLNKSGILTQIFSLLGTPTEQTWPELTSVCDFIEKIGGPKKPKDLEAEFPTLKRDGVDLLSKMLCLCPNDRISAEEAINHPYFHDSRESMG